MDMSLGYLEETVAFLETRGFTSKRVDDAEERDGAVLFDRSRFQLDRGDSEQLVIEYLKYPSGDETYWLELVAFHGMRTYNFEIDSWKHRPDRIEFRYYPRGDGVALTFILALPEPEAA